MRLVVSFCLLFLFGCIAKQSDPGIVVLASKVDSGSSDKRRPTRYRSFSGSRRSGSSGYQTLTGGNALSCPGSVRSLPANKRIRLTFDNGSYILGGASCHQVEGDEPYIDIGLARPTKQDLILRLDDDQSGRLWIDMDRIDNSYSSLFLYIDGPNINQRFPVGDPDGTSARNSKCSKSKDAFYWEGFLGNKSFEDNEGYDVWLATEKGGVCVFPDVIYTSRPTQTGTTQTGTTQTQSEFCPARDATLDPDDRLRITFEKRTDNYYQLGDYCHNREGSKRTGRLGQARPADQDVVLGINDYGRGGLVIDRDEIETNYNKIYLYVRGPGFNNVRYDLGDPYRIYEESCDGNNLNRGILFWTGFLGSDDFRDDGTYDFWLATEKGGNCDFVNFD